MHAVVARSLYFALQRARREPVREALADVIASEYLPLDRLQAIQARRQLEQLRFACAHVPWYREHYAPFAADIERARTWDELDRLVRSLPVLEKETVQDRAAELTADNARDLPTYPDKTSGSSGTPLIFPCDQRAWAYRHALIFRCMRSFDVDVGEPHALFFGLHWNRRARLQVSIRDRILNRARISAYEIAPEHVDQHLRTIERARPTHFWGYPSAISDFCSLVKDRGYDMRRLRLKAIFLTAEPCRPQQRAVIEEVTGARCVDTYGSAEGGLGAFECPAGALHVAIEATWLTLRDSTSMTGDAVVTDMMLRAFPMIRYAIGDELRLREGTCSCGRAHPMLAAIEGRAGKPIVLPNGRRINANLPSYIFKPLASLAVIRRYRFVQYGNDRVELYLLVSDRFNAEHREIVERETRAAFGDDFPLSIQVVPRLPDLANAKHRDYIVVE